MGSPPGTTTPATAPRAAPHPGARATGSCPSDLPPVTPVLVACASCYSGSVNDQEGSELRRHRWYTLLVVSIGTFMTPLDSSIVAVALPTIGADLRLSYSQGLWAQAAYILFTTVLLIPAGRIADARGPVRYYLLGIVVFAVGSVAAALSPTGPVLIASRCVQGAGGAFMFATNASIVTAAFPARERGRALGLNVASIYLGLTSGPVVGGLIVDHASWRWIFYINVPIAVVNLAAGWRLALMEHRDRAREAVARVPLQPGRGAERPAERPSRQPAEPRPGGSRDRVDWPGALLLGGALAALFVPLTFSPLWGWGDAMTIGLLAAAAAFFVGFVLREDRTAAPMLDLDLIRRNRLFARANSAALLNQMANYAVTTLTAVFLVIVQGRTAQETGLMLLTQPVLMALLAPVTGGLSDRVGSRALATMGVVIMAGGMTVLAFASASVALVLLALAIIGIGNASFNAPNLSAIMGSVARSNLSLASAFLGAVRFCGQGLSLAVLGAIAAWKLGPEGGRVIFLGESGSSTGAPAFADGFRVAMLVAAGICLTAAVLSWKAKPEAAAKP